MLGFVPNISAVNMKSRPNGTKSRRKSILSTHLPHHVKVNMKTNIPATRVMTPAIIRPILAPREIATISYLFPDGLNLCRP